MSMGEDQRPDHDEGFDAELSDLRNPSSASARQPASGGPPWQSRSQTARRVRRLVVLIAVGLVVALLIVLNWPAARGSAIGLFVRPSPTPTHVSATNDFYLLPNPPGVTVWLDGLPLQSLPEPGGQPLILASGHHTLEWLPGWFPFQDLACVVSVPPAGSDTCVLLPGYALPAALIPAGVSPIYLEVIETRESLATLLTGQASVLTGAIQQALDTRTATATIAVGEHFYAPDSNGSYRVMVATQPLRATLRLLLRGPGSPGGCSPPQGAVQPCRAPGQDCSAICTLLNPSLQLSGLTWPAGVVISTDWTYTTLGGQSLVQHVGDPGLNAHLAVTLLDWYGPQWSVTPIVGHRMNVPESDDALCDPARNWLASGPLAPLLAATEGTPEPTFQYASAGELTDGCVVSLTKYEPTVTGQEGPPALFLERFGVLLAVNDAAHGLWPELPRADAAEVALAGTLATSAGISH
jgi:hypothetical protein